MVIILFLVLTEILSVIALREILQRRSAWIFPTALVIHFSLSVLLWVLIYRTLTYRSFFDNPDHIALLMNLTGAVCAIVLPRLILIVPHFTGKLFRIRKGGYVKWMTNSGAILAVMMFSLIAFSTFYTRFNFKVEKVEMKIKGLNGDLDGLKIVQLSDLHLSAFHNHGRALARAVGIVNAMQPDLILNTGDFVTYGWREFSSNDTILSRQRSRYGNFAVMGNHDFGTYNHDFTVADRKDNVLIINNKAKSSGYTVLNDTNMTVAIKGAKIGLVGIITKGKHRDIVHGNLDRALAGLGPVDLTILLSHDPNQWEEDVVSKTAIDITLSGHTHAMQMGIYTKFFRWSPAKYMYPHWNGLYSEGRQLQYVNRGLGVLGVPFRIWMPPEITLITLRKI